MGCRNSKPADGMKPGTEPTEIWADNIWHQEGVDGQTYLILKDSLGCHTYCALTSVANQHSRVGKFIMHGQLKKAMSSSRLFEVRNAQKEIRRLADSKGVDIHYETFEYGTGKSVQPT